MKKLLLILLCLPMIGFGQDNYVTFLDGETMKRDPFINECMVSMSQSVNKKMFKNGGLDYCHCWLDKLAKKYTFSEFQFNYYTASTTTENFEELGYQLFNNPKIMEITKECMQDSTIVNDGHIEINSKEMLALHIVQCKEALKAASSLAEYNEFLKYVYIDEYCACYMQKMTNEFTLKEMDNLEQSDNLIKLEKIQEECMFDNLK